MRMDAADWALVRELYRWDLANFPQGPLRASLRDLGKRLGLHRNTVQSRLSRLRRAGVLEGIVFEPRPAPLGLMRAGTLFMTPDLERATLLASMERRPNVSSAVVSIGNLFLHSWHDQSDGLAAWQAAMAADLGATGHQTGYVSTEFPPSPGDDLEPTPLDLRVMRELRKRPGSSLADVGRRLGVTARTAEARAKRLIERGAGAMVPLLRPSRAEGTILVQFVAWRGDERAPAAFVKEFPDRIIGPFGRAQVTSVLAAVATIEEAESRARQVGKHPGVGKVMPCYVRDVEYPAAFEGWLEERFASVQRRVAPSQVRARPLASR